MSKQVSRWFCVAALVVGGFALDAPTAEAGQLFRRGRRAAPVRYATPRYRTNVVRTQSTTRRYQSGSQKQWPGTIGAMSPRYEFFQNINGYWK